MFYGPKWQPLRDVFDNLPEKTQHELTFAPKAGEWGDRVRFWKQELRNASVVNVFRLAVLGVGSTLGGSFYYAGNLGDDLPVGLPREE